MTHLPSFARDADGRLTATNENGPFSCVGCLKPLVYRRRHRRSRCSGEGNRTTFAVRGHFAHLPSDHGCNGETWLHLTAKALLIERPDHPMRFHCAECGGGPAPFAALPAGRRVAEHAIATGGRRVLDVAVLAPDGGVIGAIEVRHTHACDDAKLLELCDILGDRWCEVDAADVLEAVALAAPIPVATCASSVCGVCEGRRLERLAGLRTRLVRCADELAALEAQCERAEEQRRASSESLAAARRQAIDDRRLTDLVTSSSGGKTILDSGKYCGVTLEALLAHDAGYVDRIARGTEEHPSGVVLRARQLMRNHCRICGVSRGPNEGWKAVCRGCHQN